MPSWSEQAFTWLWQVSLRATLLTVVILGVVWLLRRRSAALRRTLLRGGLAALATLPLLTSLVPPLPVALPGWNTTEEFVLPPLDQPQASLEAPYRAPAPPPMAVTPAVKETRPTFRPAWLLPIWAFGLLVMLARSTAARLRVARWVARARNADASLWPPLPGLVVRDSDDVSAPLTTGVLRPIVLVPAVATSWSPGWRRLALLHERAHVQAGDGRWQLVAEVVRAFYWFHPLVHAVVGDLAQAREQAADDEAIAAENVDPVELASLLYALATERQPAPSDGAVMPILARAGLKARVVSLLDQRRRRGVMRAPTRLALAISALALSMTAASATPTPARTVTEQTRGGRVLDRQGRPVAGSDVELMSDMGLPLARTTTDDQGWFARPKAPMRWGAVGGVVAYVRKGREAARKPLAPTPDDPEARLVLQPASSIRGVVRDEKNQPVAQALVRLAASNSWAVAPHAPVFTDHHGRYDLPGVLPGRYWLMAQVGGRSLGSLEVQVEEKDLEAADMKVAPLAPAVGQVTGPDGRPLAIVRRGGSPQNGRRHVDWDLTGPDGQFRLLPSGPAAWEVMPPETFRLQLAPATISLSMQAGWGYVGVRPQYTFRVSPSPRARLLDSGMAFIVQLMEGTMMHGLVQDTDGKPVANARVTVHRSDVFKLLVARTSPDGRFSLGPLPEGRAIVAISTPEGPLRTRPYVQPTRVERVAQSRMFVFTIP
jgi:beta-lactamase regulating signal transducer with metallopeptidase domain